MLRSILARLVHWSGTDGNEESAEESPSGFRRSQLDASVLYAHGADVGRLDREIARIEERAREIEDEAHEMEGARDDG